MLVKFMDEVRREREVELGFRGHPFQRLAALVALDGGSLQCQVLTDEFERVESADPEIMPEDATSI